MLGTMIRLYTDFTCRKRKTQLVRVGYLHNGKLLQFIPLKFKLEFSNMLFSLLGTPSKVIDHEKCLYASDFDLGWVESTNFCVGALESKCTSPYCKPSLVSVHSDNQSVFINDWIKEHLGRGQSTHTNYWTALRKHCMHCNWAWDDLSPLEYT